MKKEPFKVFLLVVFFTLLTQVLRSQSVTGFVSHKLSAAAEGCGCTGCNDAAYMSSVTYPDPNGGCGTTEPSANSGGCLTITRSKVIVIPAGCAVTVKACCADRSGCSGTNPGPGMDSGDQFSIVGSGGTVNGNSGVLTGASNQQVCATINQTGGQISLNLTSNRVSEMLSYTITYSGGGCIPSPLPVVLVDFSVEHGEGEIDVLWSTASEKNSSDFDIEYSYDAVRFNKIASVPAAGNSRKMIHYHKSLPDTFKTEILYFRLRQNDLDGSYYYSPIVYLVSHFGENFKIKPNPTESGEVSVSVNDKVKLPAFAEILDATGRKLSENYLTLPETTVDLKPFQRGVYTLRISSGGRVLNFKIIYL